MLLILLLYTRGYSNNKQSQFGYSGDLGLWDEKLYYDVSDCRWCYEQWLNNYQATRNETQLLMDMKSYVHVRI